MNTLLRSRVLAVRWYPTIVLLCLLAMGRPGQALAQVSPGTLSPATSTVCAGFNSGVLTLSGNTNPVVKFQADFGSGFVDIASSAAQTYTFANLTQTTSYRAVTQGSSGAATSNVAVVTVNQPPTATINSQGPTTFCQRGTIFLVAGPSGTGYSYQFLLNGRDIAGATAQTYTANVTAAGNYSVRVTDAFGCSSVSALVQVRVNANNVLALSAGGPTTFCQGGSVQLSANITGGGTSSYTYQYQLNGNQIPGATSATYTATASGTYSVVAYNPSTCSSTSNDIVVTVNPVTTVTLSYPAPSYCQSGPSSPTATVSLTGGTFFTSTGLSLNTGTGAINLAQSQPGTYIVGYTSAGTCPASAATSVTITAAPTAGFSYVGGSRCAGSAGAFAPTAATGATAGSYTATPTGLSLNASTGAINLAQSQAGTYTVTNTIAAANGCAATSATTAVVLTAQPVAVLAAGGPTTFCQGGSVVLTAGGGATGATYQFLNTGQAISGATLATYTATAGGSYSVVVTNASGCASTSPATTVIVSPATTATFTYPAASFCRSSALLTTPTITGTAGGTFAAPTGLAISASTGAITPNASTAGTYVVSYTVAGSCPSSSTASITITAPATATFSYANAAFCATGTAPASLAAGSTAGTFASTSGLVLNASTGAINLGTSTAGTYPVTNTVAASGGCAATVATATVTVSPLPAQPVLTFLNGVLSTGAVAGASYQFYLNGSAIAGATGATFAVAQNGSYTVVVTGANGCASLPSAALAVVVTATHASQAAFELTAYPNPTLDGRLTVAMSGAHPVTQLTVFNALGQQMLTATVPAAATSRELDLSGVATGIYMLRATTASGTVTQRIVRQ
ncbi:T9SS type A sorting domain-containing protein [Hymenobacter terricola]|uniref:T9SS type A sorting domain-containing protein n=1 Tax=Hymenobacter terricola TaxID=2819236 RepID=UPI001B3149AA|nr:T9SS type A sorting domain-containing protein [Hymenobacter terricola]